MLKRRKPRLAGVMLMSMSTPVGKGKLFTFPAGKKRKERKRKLKKFSLVGAAKEARKGIEAAKAFRLRHLQRKRKSIYY